MKNPCHLRNGTVPTLSIRIKRTIDRLVNFLPLVMLGAFVERTEPQYSLLS